MRRALLILTAQEAAAFSERAATEGEHRTLGAPPGAALLGWAASQYDDFGDSQYDVFHGGKVCFSNALPLTEQGAPAWPMPQLITEPKHTRGGVGDDKKLCPVVLLVGRKKKDPDQPDETDVQYETLGKTLFVSADGQTFDPNLDSRLRTATEEGRGATGKLFGYRHISPAGAPRYAATLEARGLDPETWAKLKTLFHGRTLYLGRAARTSYGGAYSCIWKDLTESEAGPWPKGQMIAGSDRVRVWALSDLALADRSGAPCFAPTPALVGLPEPAGGWKLDGADSAIATRRYAPWNAHLGRREMERQVISAGSVISFTYDPPITQTVEGPGAVGLWQETGLGRVWVAPPLLDGNPGDHPRLEVAEALVDVRSPAPVASPTRPANEPLLAWLEARR